jgi:acyl dehydratase
MLDAARLDGRTGLFFEDFEVGQRYESAARVVTSDDIRRFAELSGDRAALHLDAEHAAELGFSAPIAHGPLVLGMVLGLLFEEGTFDRTAVGMLDVDWRFLAPVVAGDTLRYVMTITRCRRSSRRPAGVIGRHFTVLNQDDVAVQSGTSTLMVRTRAAAPDPDPSVRRDFCSLPWARQLRPLIEADPAFKEATATFDGSVGLQCGRDSIQLRIYKGAIIDVARSTPAGPSFTVIGDELAWVTLALAERNDFIARASVGDFSMSGSAFEYLRLIKAVVVIWDAIRTLAVPEAAA